MYKDIKSIIKVYRQISWILTKKQKSQCVGILIIIIVSSFAELLSVAIILPFVQLFVDSNSFLESGFLGSIYNSLGITSNTPMFLLTGLLVFLVYLFKNLFLTISSKIQIDFRWKIQKDLSVKLFNSYLRRPYSFFLDANTAQVYRGVNDDVYCLYNIVEYTFYAVSYVLTILLTSAYLIYIDWQITLGTLLLVGVIFTFTTFVFRRKLSGISAKQRFLDTERNRIAFQAINGIKEIDVMQRREFFVNEYERRYEQSIKPNVRYNFFLQCPNRLIELGCIAGIIVIVSIKYMFSGAGTLFVANMATFVMGVFKIMPYTASLVNLSNNLVYYWSGVNATYNNLCEVKEYEESIKEYIEKNNNNIEPQKDSVQENVCIKDICWKYPNTDKNVLDNLSFTINKNQSIGIIGSSGAGKSTLSDIILGLYKPQSGQILVDGIDIYSIPNDWSKLIGYVPQSVFILDGTVRENVTFGLDSESINEEKIWSALDMAQLGDYIRELPDGLDTLVGERGIKFSGGQRQRLAIARALYYDPQILVLDEATSALDTDTEEAVMEAIDTLLGKKTLIIVAHRLTTIKKCDVIYEIKDGKAFPVDKSVIFDSK